MGSRIKQGGRNYVKLEEYHPKVGDRVRSYDFPMQKEADADCYVEGVIEEIVTHDANGDKWDCPRYKIKVDKRVWCCVEDEVIDRPYVYPPVNGTPSLFGGKTMCVQKVA